ncbi:hypothetical protein ACQUE6_16640, partial [Enterococcus casseliflavus]|uniref:hypothetical protein n=1 Tax=Enterococcus casseliflavus TaxID=37734 RepID=UPI003D0B55A4
IVIPPAIFFYYSTLSDSRFKTLQQNRNISLPQKNHAFGLVTNDSVSMLGILISKNRLKKRGM